MVSNYSGGLSPISHHGELISIPGSIRVRNVVEMWHTDKFFYVYFGFPLSLKFLQSSIFIFILNTAVTCCTGRQRP